MSADKDIVERLQSAGHFYAPPHDAILYEAAAEIVRLRGEVDSLRPWQSAVLNELAGTGMDAEQDEPPHYIVQRVINWHAESTLALQRPEDLVIPAPAMPNGVEAARVLADFAETAPGRLPGRVQDAIATVRAADNRDAAGVDSEEDAYVIERMGKMLAEISVIVNGPEPAGTKWSYHDLPAKVAAMKGGAQ